MSLSWLGNFWPAIGTHTRHIMDCQNKKLLQIAILVKESHTDLDTSQAIPFTCEHCVCISVDSGTSPLSHTHEDKRFFRSCHLGRSLGVSSGGSGAALIT